MRKGRMQHRLLVQLYIKSLSPEVRRSKHWPFKFQPNFLPNAKCRRFPFESYSLTSKRFSIDNVCVQIYVCNAATKVLAAG